MNWLRKLLLTVLLLFFAGALVCLAPLNLGERNDFINFYGQSIALHQGLPLYDEGAQTKVLSYLLRVGPGIIVLHPTPYPPWHAILLFFLAFFPLQIAARIWFSCNVAMLIGGLLLVTHGWSIRKQFICLLGSILFPPVIGLLVIGQVTMPILLGIGLCCYGVRRKKACVIALGLFLFTLKPHLGILLFLTVFVLSLQRLDFFKRTLLWFTAVFGVALIASFFVEPQWVAEMMHALSRFSALPVNVQRDTCSSLTIELSRYLSLDNIHSLWLGIANMIVALTTLVWIRFSNRKRNIEPTLYISLGVLLTLLAVPYVRNYDYVLLLGPLAVGVGSAQLRTTRGTVLIAYALSCLITLMMPRELQGRFLWIGAFLPLFPLVRELRLRTFQCPSISMPDSARNN
jgi:hypothetical protein